MPPTVDPEELDPTDRRILELLERHPGWTLAEVAESTGKSESTIKSRVRGLQENGLLVHGWVVIPSTFFFSVRYLVHVNLDVHKIFEEFGDPRPSNKPEADNRPESECGIGGLIRRVNAKADECPYKDTIHIEETYQTMGEHDLIFEIFTDSSEAASRFIIHEIASIAGVIRTVTSPAIRWDRKKRSIVS